MDDSFFTVTVSIFKPVISPSPGPHLPWPLFSVEEIVKEIKEFQGLQALRLEGNTIGVEAAQAIAKALETKSKFKVFILDLFD